MEIFFKALVNDTYFILPDDWHNMVLFAHTQFLMFRKKKREEYEWFLINFLDNDGLGWTLWSNWNLDSKLNSLVNDWQDYE